MLGIHVASGTTLYIQFVRITIFMSLHVPAGACIPVASVSPIHVFPIQRVLKHYDAHKTRQLGCNNNVPYDHFLSAN